MKTGIIGCGVISNTYIKDIQQFYKDSLELVYVADVEKSVAQKAAEKYGISSYGTVEELLSDPEVEIVINLTPPKFHVAIDRQIIDAGKHVYSEKPFAQTLSDAKEIAEYAYSHKVEINGAPDTYLSAPIQNCKRLIQDGWIGRPLYVVANVLSHGMETWHPAPDAFYKEDAGPVFDIGGYYLTALVTILGPVERIFAYGSTGTQKREIYCGPRKGKYIDVETPTTYLSLIRMKSGVNVSLNISFDAWKTTLPLFEIYGTEGTMCVPDPNMTGGQAKIYRQEQTLNRVVEETDIRDDSDIFYTMPNRDREYNGYLRGAGVASMAAAIERGEHVDNSLVIHVTEALAGLITSAQTGQEYIMTTNV